MKKIFAVLFALVLSLAFISGCNNAPKGDEGETDTPSGTPSDADGSEEEETGDGEEDKTVSWEEDGVLKILMIGNSYSDDSMEYVYEIAKSMGVESVKCGILYIGGCTLDTHVNNAKYNSQMYDYRVKDDGTDGEWVTVPKYRMKDAIQSEDWDWISFQQQHMQASQPETYGGLEYMETYVRRLNKTAKFAWNLTWSTERWTEQEFLENFGGDNLLMYEAIVNAVQQKIVPDKKIHTIIPSGTAVQNARTSFIGKLPNYQMSRDGGHLNYKYGRWTVGLTVFTALTGIAIDEERVFVPSGVDEAYQQVCFESAKNAVEHPYEVTQSVYTEVE